MKNNGQSFDVVDTDASTQLIGFVDYREHRDDIRVLRLTDKLR